jgi:Fic family protein
MYQPHFNLSFSSIKALAKTEAANQLGFCALVPVTWQRKWSNKAIPWTVSANVALDGNPLSFDSVEKIVVREPARDDHAPYVALQAGVESTPEQAQEVINFLHTLKYINQLTGTESPPEYGNPLLLDLHALVAERTVPLTQVGAWRTVKLVVRQESGGEVMFSPPAPVELKYQLDDFWQWLNSPAAKELPVLVKAAITWAELSRIHPFAVANGRVTRAFVRLILEAEGFSLGQLLPYEQELFENRSEYYRILINSIKQNDLSAWIEYYLLTWSTAAESFMEKLNSKDTKATLALTQRPLPLRDRQIKLLEYLRQNHWSGVPQMREMFPDISDDSILRDLKDLMKKGLVKKRGKTKASRYTIKSGAW